MDIPQIWTEEEEQELFRLIVDKKYNYRQAAEQLGRSKDSIRHKWNRIQSRPLSKSQSSPSTITEEQQELSFVNKQVRAAKADIKRRSELKVFNALLRERAQKELIADKLVAAVEALPKVNFSDIKIKMPKKTKGEEVAVLVLSDLHCGLAVKKEEVCFLGDDYSVEVFRKRMKNLTNSVIEIIDLHRNLYPIKKLVIFCLGDLVHGMNDVGQWSQVYLEQDIINQIFECMSEMEKMILQYVQFFDNVEFYGVYGNHSRIAKQGIEKDFANWDYLMYKYLEQGLKNQSNLDFIYDRSWAQVATVMNQKFLLIHGDEMNGLNGMIKAEQRYQGLFQHFKSSKETIKALEPYIEKIKRQPNNPEYNKEFIEAVMLHGKSFSNMVCGHIHNPNVLTTNYGGRLIVNGSFMQGDNYSIKRLQSMCKPSQKLFGVNKDRITFSYDVDLDKEN